jgi:hypothetical protein
MLSSKAGITRKTVIDTAAIAAQVMNLTHYLLVMSLTHSLLSML